MAPSLTPVVGTCRNPLLGMRPQDMAPAPLGQPIRVLADEAAGPLVLRLNGEWTLRAGWDRPVAPGDVIEFYEFPPQSKGGIFETILGYAIAAVGVLTGQLELAKLGIGLVELGVISIVTNLLLPQRHPQGPSGGDAKGVYDASLSGNVATLDTPIWKIMGRVKITPNFAAQPYTRFLPSDPAHTEVDNDEYYYAILVLGEGDVDIEKVFLGRTPIDHYSDVLTAAYLAPGVAPAHAQGNVVGSEEVSAQLELNSDQYAGPFVATRPSDTATVIEIDIGCNQGLGTSSGGSVTVQWQVEAREIDQFGRPVSGFSLLGSEGRTAYTNTPQRWTFTYTLAAPIRCEVRVVRTNAKSSDANTRDGLQWIGMRATLSRAAPLNANAAHYEIVMRASSQLSNLTERDVSMIVRGKCRTWTPGGGWAAKSFQRNPAWWLADLWTSTTWGEGLDDDRVDLQGLYDWSLTLAARQDHIDYALTSSADAWEAAQLIARCGRARAFRAAGAVRTIARDELQDLPVSAITPRTAQPGSMVMKAKLPQREQANGVIAQWLSNVTWDAAEQECPCPGFSVTDPADLRYDHDLPPMDQPVYKFYDGITGATHAEREGLYDAADMLYRQTTVEATVEMEGIAVRFLQPLLWQPQIAGYGQAGDVTDWDLPTLTATLSEPPDWSTTPVLLVLQRDDLTLTTAVAVTPGATAYQVVLPAAPDFDLIVDDGNRERPKYILGPATGTEFVKVASIGDGGKTEGGAQLYKLTAVIDDDRVHAADNALLPGPGDVQDPIDDGTEEVDSGGGTAVLVRLGTHYPPAGDDNGGKYGVRFHNDGSVTWETYTDPGHVVLASGTYGGEWLNQVVDPTTAGLFEARATLVVSGIGSGVGTFGSWVNLGSATTFTVDASAAGPDALSNGRIEVEIRRVGSTITQGTGSYFFLFGHLEP